jgi:hypothetical protein
LPKYLRSRIVWITFYTVFRFPALAPTLIALP